MSMTSSFGKVYGASSLPAMGKKKAKKKMKYKKASKKMAKKKVKGIY